jgi:hypothetical protein
MRAVRGMTEREKCSNSDWFLVRGQETACHEVDGLLMLTLRSWFCYLGVHGPSLRRCGQHLVHASAPESTK